MHVSWPIFGDHLQCSGLGLVALTCGCHCIFPLFAPAAACLLPLRILRILLHGWGPVSGNYTKDLASHT